MMKSMFNHLRYIPASRVCRAILFIAFLLMGDYAIAQTVTGRTITHYVQAQSGSYTANFQTEIEAAFAELELDPLDPNTCFTRWDVVYNGNLVTLNHNYAAPSTIQIDHGGGHWLFDGHYSDGNKQFGYYGGLNSLSLADNLNATIKFGDGLSQLGCKIECWVTNVNSQTNADPGDGYIVKVEVILNEDGQGPYEFINETDIAATKVVVPITDYEAATKVLDVSDALVAGAKYARIYVSKYGNANAESANLTITYDGAAITPCPDPHGKYGRYLSEAGGIDVNKLSVTGLDADEMIKYNVVIVSADEELSGDQEPAWDKKTVYSFQKDIKIRVEGGNGNDDNHLVINHQDDILTILGSSVSDFSNSLYAKWYVLNPSGVVQEVTEGSYSGGTPWRFDLYNSRLGAWTNDNNILRYFTDETRTSAVIKSENGWTAQIAKANGIYVPNAIKTIDYVGYKVVFEFSDEYDTSTGTEPAYKLKYTTVIVDPNAFTGELSDEGETDGMTQTVTRNAASVALDLTTGAFTHDKLASTDLKYARFYLVDINGNALSPAGKLTVTYDGSGDNVTTCTNTEEGYYIYLGLDGDDNIQTLDKSKISVTLTAPKAYKQYKVVGVFSTAMTEKIPEDGSTPLTREPDWELQYTYDFSYPNPTTKEIAKELEWRRTGMTAHASTLDPDTDWDTSWGELSVGQYVKWYVVDGSGVQQTLVEGNSRQTGTTDWAIDATDYTVSANAAVLTGQSTFTAVHWNTWSKPAIYAPAEVDFYDVDDYKVICEIYANSDGTGNPNARYTFSLYKSYLGELKDGGTTGGETIEATEGVTTESMTLAHVTTAWGGSGAKYARVWLTTADGDMVVPTGKLSVPGMIAYTNSGNTDVSFGYYLANEGGIDLSELTATLNLETESYEEYQVHVALSTDALGANEPDYDYIYTFGFKYPVKTKYKTLLYDTSTGQCTPHLIGNWQELAVDCGEGRTNLADKLYVRWYLTAADGETLIPIDNFTDGGYTAAGSNNGYYRKGFDASNFNNKGTGTAYNPTITLPSAYRDGDAWKNVRVVCVATTQTDGYTASPWSGDPQLQVKYVYTLHTAAELDEQPFVHYQGEAYRYLMNMGEKEQEKAEESYDFITPAEATGVQGYVWNSSTNSYTTTTEKIRQNVHTVDYYYYLNLNTDETASLLLPLQYYNTPDPQSGNPGNDTEPRGYFRWYDYKTDANSAYLANPGSNLVEKDYGYIAFPSGDDPTQARIGIDFKAPAGFSSLPEEILIACDVSRYMDGMDDSFTYLVHEPTLSIRYLFHILPASVIEAEIREKANANSDTKTGLAAVEEKIMGRDAETDPEKKKLSILENDGRVVVSTNNGSGEFTLRTDLSSLGHYYVNNGGLSAATQLQWYAYYQDQDGKWWKKTIAMGERGTSIQAKYTIADLKEGTWAALNGGTTPPAAIGMDDHVQMVACAGAGGVEMPIIWTELVFLDAAPQALGSESEERTVGYMNNEYTHAKTLDFNEFFREGLKTPVTSFDNYTKIPLEIPDAQYGFCYPQLYGLCATNKYAGWGAYGISPLHGDYTLLKSMNMAGISEDWEYRDNQSIASQWWWTDPLFDVTHERASGKGTNNTNDYGAFLYVDAADEARTIATLEFDAALCHDAKIYYTAYVASMTDNLTKPMVRFRVLTDDDKGGRMPVVTFVTGDLPSELGGSYGEAQWYQVYGHTTIPSELDYLLNGAPRHYYVEIDNYCDNTNGADYCVDQISFYTSTAQVKVRQIGTPCDEGAGVEVKIIAEADKLIEKVGAGTEPVNLYYRIFKKHDDMTVPLQDIPEEEIMGEGVYTGGTAANNSRYATVPFIPSYNLATLLTEEAFNESGETRGYFIGDGGVVYYQFDNRNFPLEVNSTYFVSFYELGHELNEGFAQWGNPYGDNACSVYSNYITPNLLRIDLESEEGLSDGTIGLGCGVDEVRKTFSITVQYPTDEGYVLYDDVTFDFYEGSKAAFKAITDEGGTLYLEKALDHFRVKYPAFVKTNENVLPTDYDGTDEGYTEAMHDLLQIYVNNGSLKLLATTEFEHVFEKESPGEKRYAAIPVTRYVDADRYICSPLEFVFNVEDSYGAPKLELGFDDVTYPASYTKRVVRVGLEQLNKMKNDGFKLHLPVSGYKNKGITGNNGNKIHFSNAILTVSATNDPSYPEAESGVWGIKKVASIYDPDGGSDVYVGRDRMYLPLDFSGCEIEFHEGYYYELSTSFYDEEDDSEENKCSDDLYIVFKIVPEFVTWNAQLVPASEVYSGSWHDDLNWNRSTRAELYKDDVATHSQNTPTAGHPDRYQDNEEINPLLTERPGFVPMKFTYVTMLSKNHSPSLINEAYGGKVPGTAQTGGDLINPTENSMGTDTSPSIGSSSYPTTNIRYDMLVRYGTHANGGEGCFGHRYMKNDGSFDDDPRSAETIAALTNVFDVEKFYGNICKEIYFKPNAELRLQQRLIYEKAWVEKELIANKWYLMSVPLKGTYAGDMYVPNSATAVDNGRQITEAFQPIEFGDGTGLYSRTKYPVYQRSWGLNNAKVYTKTDDVRATDYSAKLNFGTLLSNIVEWSHTYNDVQVPYTAYSGFAIRAHKKDQKDGDDNDVPALIRLPKADTSYDYYQWNNEVPGSGAVTAQGVTKGETVYGKLVFDNTSGDQEQWSISLASLQAQGTDEDGYNYYLVGNPFMSSIDMGKFFGYQDGDTYYSYNPKLDPVYYTYDESTLETVDATTEARLIRPMQAFIVRCKAADAPENIVFNRWVITDYYTPPTLYVPEDNGNGNNPARELTLVAENNTASSKASVILKEQSSDDYVNGEDVTTLFDSNLSGVPTIFTVSGNHALSIDKRSAISVVPFGVVCAGTEEPVTVTLEGTVDGQFHVLDAMTGERTEVEEGTSFTVVPNDYGRYFLLAGALDMKKADDVQKGVFVSVRGNEVTVTSSEDISRIRALSLNGTTMYQAAACGTSASFTLTAGVYIIKAENVAGDQQTVKIIVK